MGARLYIALAVALVIGALGWYAKSQTERAAIAEAQVKTYTAALKKQNKAVKAFEFKLAEREEARQTAADNAARWRQKWKEAKHDPIVKEWASIPLPGPVRIRVCEYARCNSGGETGGDAPESSNAAAALLH